MDKKFGAKYFQGYYKENVGSFTIKDLNKSINWFTGWFNFLQKFVDLREGKKRKVLEVGCSIGGASSILADRGFEVFASDTSDYVIKKASKLAEEGERKISFLRFDVQREIPIKQNFDIIFSFEVIEHLENPLKAIGNIRSKLKAKGLLICSTPDKNYDMSSDPTHINVKTKEEWVKVFKKAGFRRIEAAQISFLPFFYKLSKNFHFILPFPIRSKYINSPLFIIARK
jgi:SAM-dependent methyltransferase